MTCHAAMSWWTQMAISLVNAFTAFLSLKLLSVTAPFTPNVDATSITIFKRPPNKIALLLFEEKFIKYSFAPKYLCWNSTISKSVIKFYNGKRPQYSYDSILIQRQHPGQLGLNTSSGGELIIARRSHQLTDQIFNKNIKMLITFSLPGTLLEHGGENLQYVEPISAILNFCHLNCVFVLLFGKTQIMSAVPAFYDSPIYIWRQLQSSQTFFLPVCSISSYIAFLRGDSFFLLTSFCFKMQMWEGGTLSLIWCFPSIRLSWGKGNFDLEKRVGKSAQDRGIWEHGSSASLGLEKMLM